jgi:anti-sigma factor RsiW
MDCPFITDHLFAIAEETLQPAERETVEAHLRVCPECAQLINRFRSINDTVQTTRSVEPNPYLSNRTIAHLDSLYLRNSESQPVWNRFFLRPAFAGLFVGLAILSGIFLGRNAVTNHSKDSQASTIEVLRSELYISELADEDLSLIANQ